MAELSVVPTESTPTDESFTPDELFLAFYAAYPRKEARKDARKAWGQMPPEDAITALSAILVWARVWKAQNREQQHIPLPASWLRGERYFDEAPPGFAASVRLPAEPSNPKAPYVRSEMPPEVRALIAKIKAGR